MATISVLISVLLAVSSEANVIGQRQVYNCSNIICSDTKDLMNATDENEPTKIAIGSKEHHSVILDPLKLTPKEKFIPIRDKYAMPKNILIFTIADLFLGDLVLVVGLISLFTRSGKPTTYETIPRLMAYMIIITTASLTIYGVRRSFQSCLIPNIILKSCYVLALFGGLFATFLHKGASSTRLTVIIFLIVFVLLLYFSYSLCVLIRYFLYLSGNRLV